MSDDGFVTGPHRVDNPHPELGNGLAELWGRVSAAGGAVGFSPTDSVERVRAAAAEIIEHVTERRAYMITLGREHELVGAAVLTPDVWPVRQHLGELTWIMVDPDLRGQGWDQQLHDAVLAQAQALGLERLSLHVRGGPGLERFYQANDWVERGRWPGAIRVAEGDERDDIWFTRDV